MIAPDLLADIDTVRKIRNDISHTWDTSSLSNYFSHARVMGMVSHRNITGRSQPLRGRARRSRKITVAANMDRHPDYL